MNKDEALKMWLDEIGDVEYSYDFSGKKIKQSDYLETNQVGWVVTYIKPLELGGPQNKNNSIIMHHRTLDEKGLNYPKFTIVDKAYQVIYDEREDFYYIERIINEDED